ncbi:MAG: hypothetical protein RLZ99_874, partial [Actinomycetota bacterium]
HFPLDSSFVTQAFVAQRIEHLTTDQKVGGSSPSKRTKPEKPSQLLGFYFLLLLT